MNHVSLHACTMGDGNETMFVAMKLHESTWRDPATDHQTKANTSTMPEEHSGDQSTNTNKIHMEAVTITFLLTASFPSIKTSFFFSNVLPAQRKRRHNRMKSIVLWNVLYLGWLP